MQSPLHRFYLSLAIWFIASSALGILAPNLAIVLMGLIPLGLGFILLLVFYVPETETPSLEG